MTLPSETCVIASGHPPPGKKKNLPDGPKVFLLKEKEKKPCLLKELLSMPKTCRCSHLIISKIIKAVVNQDCFALSSRGSYSITQKGLE